MKLVTKDNCNYLKKLSTFLLLTFFFTITLSNILIGQSESWHKVGEPGFSKSADYGSHGGYALKFDGVNDYASANINPGTTSSTMTMEFWFMRLSTTGWCVNDLRSISDNDKRRVVTKIDLDQIYLYCSYSTADDGGALNQSSGVTATVGVWYHVAIVINGTNIKQYVNGKERINTTLGGAYSLTGNEWLILANDYLSSSITNVKIDEVRIWTTERTDAEIKANMYKELAGSETGLLAYYKMSSGTGTTLIDDKTTGIKYNGTFSGEPAWTASGCFAGSRNALDFDGTNDFVDISNGVILGTSFTQEMWIYPKSSSEVFSGILGYQFGGPSTDRPPSIYQYGLNLHFGFADGTTWYSDNTTGAPLTVNSWNHVAMTFNGTTYLVYVNGRLRYTSLCASGRTPIGNPQRWIGKIENYFNGSIDEIRIWNDVRTESEIRENMMKTLVGNETGLAAYYRFDYNDGTTLYDLTSTARNGTLTNMDAGTDWVSSSAFNTWIGGESNSWLTAANWSSGTAPAATDNVGLYKWDLGNEASMSLTSPMVNNLLFSSTASPVLSSYFTVNGNLLLGKNLNPNGSTVRLGSFSNPGFLVEGDYRFYGSSGTISVESSWNNFSGVNVGGLGAVISCNTNIVRTITRGHAEHISGSNKSILRYYKIFEENKENAEVIEVTLKFNYLESELNGLPESNLILFKSTDDGTTWTNVGGVLDINNNNVTLTGISSIEGLWTLGSSTSPLPVELTSFSSEIFNGRVKLNWATATEVNNYGFEIERTSLYPSKGVTNENWEKVGFVQGNGNSNALKTYTFIDNNPPSGKVQYRLKQIDNDGSFKYSDYIEVNVGVPERTELHQNYPNPFNPSTAIKFSLSKESKVKIIVFDILGNVVNELVNDNKPAGNHIVYWNSNDDKGNKIASGVYFYKLEAGDIIQIKKMNLMK